MSRFGDFVNRKLEEASQCPECGCGYTNWREVCLCTHYGCECAEPDSPVRGQRGREFGQDPTNTKGSVSKATVFGEHLLGGHQHCTHPGGGQYGGDSPPDNDEYMSSMGYAGEPRGVVWGTVNPDGSVTARGFRDDESYSDDTAVHPVGSLVAYHAEDNTWVHMATGQTVERQREIDAARAARPPTNGERRVQELQVGKDATSATLAPPPAAQPWAPPTSPSSASGAGATTTTGGSGVSHAEDGNALISQAGRDTEDAMGAIQEIVSKLETALQNVTQAAQGSQHAEADTALGALQQAVQAANDLQQQVGAAKQAVEDVRL